MQPNSGAQGEYAGLLAIRHYHESRNEGHRDICLIPSSAHGTNPASAQMAGMQVVVVACDKNGNIDLADLREKQSRRGPISCIMVTYPSTHGVYEETIREVCEIVHQFGGGLSRRRQHERPSGSPLRALSAPTFRTSTCIKRSAFRTAAAARHGPNRRKAHPRRSCRASVVQIEGMLTRRARFPPRRSAALPFCRSAGCISA